MKALVNTTESLRQIRHSFCQRLLLQWSSKPKFSLAANQFDCKTLVKQNNPLDPSGGYQYRPPPREMAQLSDNNKITICMISVDPFHTYFRRNLGSQKSAWPSATVTHIWIYIQFYWSYQPQKFEEINYRCHYFWHEKNVHWVWYQEFRS